jgi:hypothetical protein
MLTPGAIGLFYADGAWLAQRSGQKDEAISWAARAVAIFEKTGITNNDRMVFCEKLLSEANKNGKP